jgi:amino acid permease
MKQIEQLSVKKNQTRDFVISLLFDAIGMMSFMLPVIGEFADVVWAPISGLIMVWMYKGTIGKVAGVVSFAEELLPATDIIPSFTLMWFYTYFIKKRH